MSSLFRNLLRKLSLPGSQETPSKVRRSSNVCLNFSVCSCPALRESGSEKPVALFSFPSGVGFMQPDVNWHVSFKLALTFLVCTDLDHTGLAYSAMEKHTACAVLQTVGQCSQHVISCFDLFCPLA